MKKSKNIKFAVVAVLSSLIITTIGIVSAYYTDSHSKINQFKVGSIKVVVNEENYEDNQTVTPNSEIVKDPTFDNAGSIDVYIRAQVYVPISNKVTYVDEQENVVTPTDEIELYSYDLEPGWQEVNDDGFSGIYEDATTHTRYRVHTYKFIENNEEKIVTAGTGISTPVFNKVKVINYLDIDEDKDFDILVNAIAVQSKGGTADELWTYYKNQNNTAIVRAM